VAEADESDGEAGEADTGGELATAGARAREPGGSDEGGGGGERADERGGGGGGVVRERAPAIEAERDESEGTKVAERWAEGAGEAGREWDELQETEAGDGQREKREWWNDEPALIGGDEESEGGGGEQCGEDGGARGRSSKPERGSSDCGHEAGRGGEAERI
jgi:hypothetical protein